MTHTIKLQEQFCDAVLSGDKCFEVRYNDRNYKVGDYVRFIPIRPTKDGYIGLPHAVINKTYVITYVLSGWGLQDGYVAFGIKEVNNGMDKG